MKALSRKRKIVSEILEKEKQAQVALPPTTLTNTEVEDIVRDIKETDTFAEFQPIDSESSQDHSSPTDSLKSIYSDEYPPLPKRPALIAPAMSDNEEQHLENILYYAVIE